MAPALLYHSEVYRDLGWYLPNLIGNLHAKQEWELFAPMLVGETVRTRSTVVDRYRKRNREYVVNEVLITDADGRWLQRSRTHQSFLADDPGDAVVVDKERERRPDRRFEVAGRRRRRCPAFAATVTLAMCEAFSGPVRNYHTDREMARALGFPDIVVQGMLSVCFISELMTAASAAAGSAAASCPSTWSTCCGAARPCHRRAPARGDRRGLARARALVDVWCEKADGAKTIVGTASALR